MLLDKGQEKNKHGSAVKVNSHTLITLGFTDIGSSILGFKYQTLSSTAKTDIYFALHI